MQDTTTLGLGGRGRQTQIDRQTDMQYIAALSDRTARMVPSLHMTNWKFSPLSTSRSQPRALSGMTQKQNQRQDRAAFLRLDEHHVGGRGTTRFPSSPTLLFHHQHHQPKLNQVPPGRDLGVTGPQGVQSTGLELQTEPCSCGGRPRNGLGGAGTRGETEHHFRWHSSPLPLLCMPQSTWFCEVLRLSCRPQ